MNELTYNGRTLTVGERVVTPMGKGTIIAFQPEDRQSLEVFVKLDHPARLGSKFWFTFQEVKAL